MEFIKLAKQRIARLNKFQKKHGKKRLVSLLTPIIDNLESDEQMFERYGLK